MKDCTQELLDLISNPKAINARATFRVMRPQFSVAAIAGQNISIADSTLIDSCSYGTGILRVTNYNNKLYYQNQQNVDAGTWNFWLDTGIALYPGSRPGVDEGYIWYQNAASPAQLHYRYFATFSTEVLGRDGGEGVAEILAPIANQRCYSTYLFEGSLRISVGVKTVEDTYLYINTPMIYDVTLPRLDAVNFSDDEDLPVDYLYFTDRDAGRIMEMRVLPADDFMKWGQPRPIIAIDAIDDVYGLNLHGAEMINGKAVVTGRLTRTSDGDPVSMDIYTFGPEDFSLGRDMFISDTSVGGKMQVVGTELVCAGANYKAIATGTNLFGLDNAANKLSISDIGHLQLQEAENRSSTASLTLASDLSHAALSRGAHVEIEVAYNDEWMKVMTGEVARIARTRGEGESLTVHLANLTAKRLSQWSPDQGIYIPSQAYTVCHASDLSKVIRADGTFIVDAASDGVYDDLDAGWVYGGANWTIDANSGFNYHSNNWMDANAYASFDFVGTRFIFTFIKNTDGDNLDIWVDGVKIDTISSYNATRVQGTYASPTFEPGLHTFKVTHVVPTSGYIYVDAIEIFGAAEVSDAPLCPAEFNKLSVLYTAARASRGGLMRAKFWNESANDIATRNPRFGVGLNYRRESRVEAAARLGLEYTDVADDMCGHNGIVAIYSRNEVSGSPGIKLYRWENSVMTMIAQYAVTFTLGAHVWLQIRLVNGGIQVSYRQDTATTWSNAIVWYSLTNSPWFHEDGGHGCVVMDKRLMRSYGSYALSADDTTLAVYQHTNFPSSGTILLDGELMTYSAKSTKTSPAIDDFGVNTWVDMYQFDAVVTAAGIPVHANTPNGTSTTLDAYTGLAAAFRTSEQIAPYGGYPSGIPGGRTFRIMKFFDPTQMWYPNDWSSGYIYHKGDTSKGSWGVATTASRIFVFDKDLYTTFGLPRNPEFEGEKAAFIIRPALHLSARGVNGTTASSHGDGWAYQHVDIELKVDEIEFFTLEEDITLADALRRVLTLAGGSVTEQYMFDVVSLTAEHTTLGPTWRVLDIDDNKKDFIAEIHIPKTVTQAQGVKIGVAFYGSMPMSATFNDGYMVCVEDNSLALYELQADSLVLLEKAYTSFSGHLCGRMRVSVQDNRFAVWLDHKLMHVFYRDGFSAESYLYKAFVVNNPNQIALPDMRFQYSSLNDLMADITVGTRGNGMTILSELTGNRRVNFRSEPDGSLYFYKKETEAGSLPDIVISELHEEVDETISRVRVEGIKIAEIANFTRLKEDGNLFETINSMYAETVQDLVADGEKVVDLLRQRSDTRGLEVVYHPALQPGDGAWFYGQNEKWIIMSTNVVLGFNGENFDVNASLEVFTA